MPAKLSSEEFDKIIRPLPARDRAALRQQVITAEWLQTAILRCRRSMKRDLWVGLPWFGAYACSLIATGFSNLSIGLLVVGLVYFTCTAFTSGAYGHNRKRLEVYGKLLNDLK